ncbi:MAG: DUF2271 domain-containing protein [Acidimicrobiia bacterium]
MRNTLLAGAAAALVPTLAACAESDEKVLAGKETPTVPPNSTTTTAPPTTAAPSTRPTTASTATPTTPGRATAPSPSPSTTARQSTPAQTPTTAKPSTAPVPSADAVPAGAKLTVDFTFAAAGGGRVNNPFVAVWIENEAGALVDTIAVWYNPPKGQRWLPDLRRFYSTSKGGGPNLATVTSATRVPGSYSVVWDATDLNAALVARGTYFVCIEAAREHGPYELIRQQISLADKSFTTALTPNGELTAAAVKFDV